ncbi:MAG: hypothetical protein AABW89_03425 [Nanoarchaeota archaeon]
MPSVTINSPDLHKEGPVLEVHFLIPLELEKKYKEEGKEVPVPVIVKALIDTGASNCVVKKEIPEQLKLEPTGIIKINTPSSKEHECYQYFMRMLIPAHGLTYQGPFIGAPLDGQEISGLVGRDLLKHSILIYIGYMNQFTLSIA